MEDKFKARRHEDTLGKTVSKYRKNHSYSSTPTGNLSIAPQTSHQSQSDDRKFSSCQCVAQSRFQAGPGQCLRIDHDDREMSCGKCSAKLKKKVDLISASLLMQYKDVALWQEDCLTGETLSTRLRYWKDKLSGFETLNLTTDYPRPSQRHCAGQYLYFELDEHLSMDLRHLAEELKVSLHTVLLTGYLLMLRCYSNQDDLVIGMPIANGNFSRIGNLIGFFVHISPIRSQIDSTSLLKDFMTQVGNDVIASRLHQDVPFEKLVEELAVSEDTSRHPIFQVVFCVHNFKTSLQSQIQDDLGSLFEPSTEKRPCTVASCKFDLTTVIDDSGNYLKGVLNYSTSLYTEETAHSFKKTYVHILRQLSMLVTDQTKKNHMSVADLSFLSAKQYHKIIHNFNATDKEYPAHKTIPQLFEEQVEKTPANIAVAYQKVQLNYRELNKRANQLANYLIKDYNIEPDNLIALCLDRSEHMLIAILAVLKSGGAYVSIDPSYPDTRIQYILKDTSTRLLITNEIHQERLENISLSGNSNLKFVESSHLLNILSIDNQGFQETLSSQHAVNPRPITTSTHLAYVMYTSGTTGKPKGVMVEHKGLVNLNYALLNRYAFGDASEREVVLLFSNYVFDISVEQIILALLNGHTLLIIPNELWLNKKKFNNCLLVNNVTHIQVTPRFLEQHNFCEIVSLKRLVSSGEELSRQAFDKIRLKDNVQIINSFGPTEASVISTCKIIGKDDLNIGSPISNTKCYVLDKNLVPVPVGATGELYIGGAGVARGYLNRPRLTAETFITNPFQTEREKKSGINTRLYKTGDLVRWLPDGNLEYKGRKDFQVKIRGYRIELGEIESALLGYAGIKQCVALAKNYSEVTNEPSGNKYIVGYFVSETRLDEKAILHYLKSQLPEYMVPVKLVYLDKLPLATNGKLDRKALPDPEFTNPDNYVAPRNEIEEKARHIWAEVLTLDANKVGIHDDFFKVGGDSITSIQLVGRLRDILQLDVSVKDIFNYQSIANLYENVFETELRKNTSSSSRRQQALLVGEVPLLPMQEWFFWRNFSAAHEWNQSLLIRTQILNLNKLEESLVELVQHHDAFRLRYRKDEATNTYHQYYYVSSKVEPVKVLDIRSLAHEENSQAFRNALEKIVTSWQSNFNLTDGPIYSVGYMDGYTDGSARIYFVLHRLIVDAVSWRILSEDLRDIYHEKILSSKRSSFCEWAVAQQNYPYSHPEERNYWNNILSDYDRNKLYKLVFSESTVNYASLKLSEECTASLLHASNQAYNTRTDDLLLTALGYSLEEITGCNINHITLEDHGRGGIDSSVDFTRTLGWFTKIYPIRLDICASLRDSIKSVKEYLRRIPNEGLGYGPIKGYKSDALPRVCFKYITEFGLEISKKLKDKHTWQIVGEDSGQSINPFNLGANIIDIECVIMEGRLAVYVISKLDKKTTNKLTSVFKVQLENIVKHTMNQPRSYLTVSDIDNIISKDRLDALQEQREIEAMYFANSLQQGFIYHALSQGDFDDAYLVQTMWQYHYPIQINNLNQAWEYAIAKFSSLRLRFDWQENLVQIIDKEHSLDWRYLDLGDESNIEKQEYIIKDIQEKDRVEKYDLSQGNLFRIYLIKQDRDLHSCVFSNHHAILDGWSMPILLKYVHDTYLMLGRKELIQVQPDNAYKAAEHYIQQHQEDDKAYWDNYIAQVEERCDLSGLLLRSEKRLSEYKHILHASDETLTITGNVYSSLKLLSRQEGVTLNAILQYVWHKVLNVYGNSKQTVVGTTVSGRSIPINDIENSVGLFINTLPLIVDHQGNRRPIDLIRDIQSSIGELNSRSIINVAKLQPSGERLFDSLFVYKNYPTLTSEAQDELKLKFKGSIEKLDYPLNVTAHEANNELTFNLQYASELFSKDTINNLLYLTRTLLEQIAGRPYRAVTSLNYLNTQQYGQIVLGWNATDEYPSNKTIHGVFEEQVEKTPDNVAIVYKDVHLTYRELNKRANKLANYLIKQHNIEPDSLIQLCLDRSEHMLIAILAVLKSGGAYVPIDPSYPDERIQYILQDTGASLLLTNEIHQERLEGICGSGSTNQEYPDARRTLSIISIDSHEFQDKLSLQAVSNANTSTTGSHLAYVIYTSGTTGKPKGVMVEHKGLVNLNYDLSKRYSLTDANDGEIILQFSNYVFDASVEQIILALLNGHVLLLIPNQLWLNKQKFHKYLFANKVTHIDATPRFLEQHNFSEILSLKRIVCGGEFLSKQSYNKISLNKRIKLINSYGLTETSVTSIVNIVRKGNLNIGSPISNTRCYVLDDNLLPLPIGAVGELYIGGVGLARGYLNRPNLTSKCFLANPFQTEEDRISPIYARLYKTGDLVRWLPSGDLEYLGRNNLQVKIRGQRIELGEIEAALLGYTGIKQCVALAKNHNEVPSESPDNKYLVGYYVSDTKLDEVAIFRYLESKLPEYMVPVVLVHINKLPLTTNGKLDRKALPDPEFTSPDSYVAPRNEIEEKACEIWAEVLGIDADKVGIHDDFFRLGGDSIISIQLVSRFRKVLHLKVSIRDIFNCKSIAILCDKILSKGLSVDRLSILESEQDMTVGAVPLLPIQEWFFCSNFIAARHWNQSFLIKVPCLDIGKLQDSLVKLVQHHDSFKLRYKIDEESNTYEQYYDGCAEEVTLKILDANSLGRQENSQVFKTILQKLLTNWQADFDFVAGPMYSVGYIYGYSDGSARIYFALHQLIGDSVSLRILCDDLKYLYSGKRLSSKGSSYRQWANAMKDYPSKHQAEKFYWKNIVSDYDSNKMNNLIESECTTYDNTIELSREYTTLLLQASNQAYNTQINDLLLTALGYSLEEITGCNIHHITLEGHGREEIDHRIDVSRTLGWFTTMYPVRLDVCDTLESSIKSTKESLTMIPHKGLGYGSIIGYNSNTLPRISFNYLGQFGQKNSRERRDTDKWQIIDEESGTSVNPKNWQTDVINFTGLIVEGVLKFLITSKLDKETANKLARVYIKHLMSIISHCKNKPSIVYTLSDV